MDSWDKPPHTVALIFQSLLALLWSPKTSRMSSLSRIPSATEAAATASTNHHDPGIPKALWPDQITVLAYGALLSEESSQLTFPDLINFRHVRVRGLRRVFAHPHLFLLEQGLVDGLRMASLSAEPAPSDSSFVVAAFDVTLNDEQRLAFMAREASYHIVSAPYYELTNSPLSEPLGTGVICLKGTDENSRELIARLPTDVPCKSIWEWPKDGGILPAELYLRHCLLAVEKGAATIQSGQTAKESFWKETYLSDRETSLSAYLGDPVVYERIMSQRPPTSLSKRFGG